MWSTIRPTQKNDNRCNTRRAVSVVGLFTCESRRHDSPDKDGGIASSSTRDLLNSQTFPAQSQHPKLNGTKNTISKHYCTFYHLPRSAAWVPHLCLQGSLFHVSMGLTFALYTSDLHPSYATDWKLNSNQRRRLSQLSRPRNWPSLHLHIQVCLSV